MERSKTGKLGEDIAVNYLKSKDYRIIQRNVRQKFDEIDIIAIDPNRTLIFIEVKTTRQYGNAENQINPEDNLTESKFSKIRRSAMIFAGKNSAMVKEDRGWQIDLLAITLLANEDYKINHYENI